MKILMVHHRVPYPLMSGIDKVCYNLIRSLATKHEVTLIVPCDEFADIKAAQEVKKICYEVVTVQVKNKISATQKSKYLYFMRWWNLVFFRVPIYITDHTYQELGQAIRTLCESGDYDLFQASSTISAGYFKFAESLRPHILGPMDDIVEATRSNMEVASNDWGLARIKWYLRLRAHLFYDIKECQAADYVFFYSDEDMKRINSLANGLRKANVLRTVVEREQDVPPLKKIKKYSPEPNSIIFVGGLGSCFNKDAVLFFYNEIFPQIKQKIPSVKFYIVGQNPPPEIQKLAHPHKVIVTGKVTDVRPYIEKAAVYVAPLRAGTGFKTKIVEALASGKAIVTTKKGVQGLWDFADGQAIQIEDDPARFATKVSQLLMNDSLRLKQEVKARDLFDKSYSFKTVTPVILNLYAEIESKLLNSA